MTQNSRLRFVRRTLVSVVDQGTISAINFITTVIAGRMLAVSDFGAYGFGMSLVFLGQTLQHSMLGETQEVLVSSLEGEAKQRMIGTMSVVQWLLTLALVIIGMVLGFLWPDPTVSTVLIGAALVSLALLPQDFIRRLLLADLRVEFTFILSISRFLVHFALLVGLYFAAKLSLLMFYVIAFAGSLAACIVGIRQAFRDIRGHFRIQRAEGAALVDFSRWIVLKNLSRYVLLNINYWLVLGVIGLKGAAVYTASYQVIAILYVGALGLSGFFTPYFSRLFMARRDVFRRRILLAMAGWMTLFLPCIAVVAIWPSELLTLFFGDKYQDSGTVAQAWSLVCLMGILTYFFDIVFKSMRRPQEAWKLQLIAMLPPLAALYYAVVRWGVVGALVCAAVQRLLLNLVMGWRVWVLLRDDNITAQPDDSEQPVGSL